MELSLYCHSVSVSSAKATIVARKYFLLEVFTWKSILYALNIRFSRVCSEHWIVYWLNKSTGRLLTMFMSCEVSTHYGKKKNLWYQQHGLHKEQDIGGTQQVLAPCRENPLSKEGNTPELLLVFQPLELTGYHSSLLPRLPPATVTYCVQQEEACKEANITFQLKLGVTYFSVGGVVGQNLSWLPRKPYADTHYHKSCRHTPPVCRFPSLPEEPGK